jgi:hypothetical protein
LLTASIPSEDREPRHSEKVGVKMTIGQVWKARVIDLNMTRMVGRQVIPVSKGEYTVTQTLDGYEFARDDETFMLSETEIDHALKNNKLKIDNWP